MNADQLYAIFENITSNFGEQVNSKLYEILDYFGYRDGNYDLAALIQIVEVPLLHLNTKPHPSNMHFFFVVFSNIREEIDDYIEKIDFWGFNSIAVEGEEVNEFCRKISVLLVSFGILNNRN